jgi:hypothetical protein
MELLEVFGIWSEVSPAVARPKKAVQEFGSSIAQEERVSTPNSRRDWVRFKG